MTLESTVEDPPDLIHLAKQSIPILEKVSKGEQLNGEKSILSHLAHEARGRIRIKRATGKVEIKNTRYLPNIIKAFGVYDPGNLGKSIERYVAGLESVEKLPEKEMSELLRITYDLAGITYSSRNIKQ